MRVFWLIFGLAIRTFGASEPGYEIETLLVGRASEHSRSLDWRPDEGLPLEVSGMDWAPDGRLAVSIRKGDLWLLDHVLEKDLSGVTYERFATGLHEPLGVLSDGDGFLVSQRSEITRIRDGNGDGLAEEYWRFGYGWNVSGAYHGYAYGPTRDGLGRLWVALNLDLGPKSDNSIGWRGWAGVLDERGRFQPMVAGLRSPCGLGANRLGDVFCVDQQGTWIPTTPIYHFREGAFFLNPDGLGSQSHPGSPLQVETPVPSNLLYPEALAAIPQMRAPAVWLPYNKVGRSGTDLEFLDANGAFGPFDGQLFVSDFTDAKVSRVFLEKVDGEYQGAVFPFLEGFASAALRLRFASDGSLFVGLSNRGWSSLGTHAYGLQRVRWSGQPPFAIQEMRARPDGFELVFTQPVDRDRALASEAFGLSSYTYRYSNAYGSPEVDRRALEIDAVDVSEDWKRVRLRVSGLRPHYVHELDARGAVSAKGQVPLANSLAYYTLNQIPGR